MSESPNNGRKPLGNNSSSMMKVLLIWLVPITLVVFLLQYSNPQQGMIKEMTISEVIAEVDLGEESRIAEAEMLSKPEGGIGYYTITGTFREGTYGEHTGFRAEGRLTEERYDYLDGAGFQTKVTSTFWRNMLLGFGPILLIFALIYWFFIRQLRQSGRGAMSFGKSKAKMLTRDRDKVTFKDVAGCDEAKEEVGEVVDFLKDPKKFQKIGGRIPKGVLLVGPPGTGKTLLARAVAGEADVPFFSISGSDFVEMFVGVGAARVRDMFEQGRKNAPCIVFIDEIDAVGRQRGAGLGGGNDEREQTLNSLLVEMDGFDGHEGVIIVAATNRPDVLDNALLRPGRFDRQIHVDLPDVTGREEILAVHAKKIKTDEELDLRGVAQATPGFSGADLANLLNEAALLAARYDAEEVNRAHIEEARDKIRFGRERRKLMDEEDKRMTAYHEAGHAVIAALLKDGKLALHKVTIIPRGRALGMTMSTPTKDILGMSKKEILDQICMTMGGRIGEEVETGDFSNGAAGDIKQATQMARHMVCDWGMSDLGPVAYGENQDHVFLGREIAREQHYSEETARKIDAAVREIIEGQFERAKEMLTAHKEALHKTADALLEYETIDGIHVHEILEHGEIRSEVLQVTSTKKVEEEPKAETEAADDDKKAAEDIGPGTAPATA